MKFSKHIRQPKIYFIIGIVCYACFWISYNIYKNIFTPANVTQTITNQVNNQLTQFATIAKEPLLIESLVNNNKIDYPALKPVRKNEFYLFIQSDSSKELLYWNSTFVELIEDKTLTNNSFIENNVGSFFLQKQPIPYKHATAFALFPITTITDINTENAKETFTANSLFHKYFIISKSGKYLIKPNGANYPIKLLATNNEQQIPYTSTQLVLLFLSLFCLFTSLHLYTKKLSMQQQFAKGLGILVGAIVIFRLFIYFSNLPFVKQAIPIFDPTIYASNIIHPSLGDLLINTFFLSWIVGYLKFIPHQKLTIHKKVWGNAIASFCLAVYVIWIFISTGIIATLIKDSQISFNVLDFYSLNYYSFLATCCLCFICVIIARLGYIVVAYCHYYKLNYALQALLIFSVSGAYILLLENENNYWYLNIVFIWIVLRIATLSIITAKQPITKFGSKLVLTGIIIYSLSCALFIWALTNNLEKKQRTNLAQRIALQYDNFKSDSLLNEQLANQNSILEVYNNYSYGFYKNNLLIQKKGDVAFATEMKFPQKPTFISNKGKNAIIYPISPGTGIVITANSVIVLALLTLFNYIFIVFLFIGICFSTYYVVLAKGQLIFHKINSLSQQIKTQLLIVIIASGFLVFSLISLVMYNYFNDQFKARFQSKMLNSIAPIEAYVTENLSSITDSTPTKIKKEFFVYNLHGKLQLTNAIKNDAVFYNTKLPFAVYKNLTIEKQDFVIDNWYSNNSNTTYMYKAIKNNHNETIAFLALTYPQAKAEQQQEISNFITALLNIIILIFITGFTVTYLFANRITSAFGIIANKMKQVSFKGTNEPITYTKNNEIKVLIDEYNNMVEKLNDSAIALAKSEREGAWKEMARQVAHEIKNPLTPMKLSLQYLQKAIQNNQPNVQALANSVSNTLTQQIDQLAKIASDFSQFANIHNINAEPINISSIVQDVVTLFKVETQVAISIENTALQQIVFADAIQLNRLFTNLIKNGIEALAEIDNPTIYITITNNTATTVLVTITDNGTGINDANIEKIFTPNFTTKSSGTGLGLAICKGIVETANGKIWFANNDVGVSFFVEFPLMVD